MAGGTKLALEIPEVDQKMWPRRGKETEEVEPVKEQRRGSCWWHPWEAVQLRARREGLSKLRHKEPATQSPNLEIQLELGFIFESSSFQTFKDLLICKRLLCARYKKGDPVFQQNIIQTPLWKINIEATLLKQGLENPGSLSFSLDPIANSQRQREDHSSLLIFSALHMSVARYFLSEWICEWDRGSVVCRREFRSMSLVDSSYCEAVAYHLCIVNTERFLRLYSWTGRWITVASWGAP